MSHVNNPTQRTINAEIIECMERNVIEQATPVYADDGDILYFDYEAEYTCGPSRTVNTATDKCPQCGKCFTY